MKFISLALAGAAGVLQAMADTGAANSSHTALAQVDECSAGRVPVAVMLHNVQVRSYALVCAAGSVADKRART